ncbi:MAG: hypothetical protein L3J66_13080 [Bacteroidales bacterium]|nr:hypothetical protein [Bacteroidales bacterium]
MNMFADNPIDPKQLFLKLFSAPTEGSLEEIIYLYSDIFDNTDNWFPLGGNEYNFAVIKNQQANPIAALIEKITNSIDAILMKKAFETGVEPESADAPRSMEAAIRLFFPDYKSWDLLTFRKKQSEEIQVVADGTPRDTSVIMYDNGEGQHPENFEGTFLSLLSGNKTKIHFVQGKYNMGGSGAIVFCGKKRYQLIASKRYDNSGNMGFTLVREHPLKGEERTSRKETWYEYFKLNGQIPSFHIDELDLKLFGRKFKTGTIIKLYSYNFPSGYSGFAQDLNQSINEYLFNPALPVFTVDSKERYPNNKVLELDLYGLKRRLEDEKDGYVEETFSLKVDNQPEFGKSKITCYVFKAKYGDKDVKKTKEDIQRRFFKNNMTVLFSINGQVHGYYTSEFITRSLKMNLLKSHLLIHVDCTEMKYEFRKELFMASRDRLKESDETRALRKYLAKELGKSGGRLAQIEKIRKDSLSVESSSTKELLQNFTKSLPKNSDLFKLLGSAFKLDLPDKKKSKPKPQNKRKEDKIPFKPERFPSFLNLLKKNDDKTPVTAIPLGGERIIKLQTDVEDYYFDRSEEPGDLKVGLLGTKQNEVEGGDRPGKPEQIEDILNVNTESPKDGIIKISFSPTDEVNVGDEMQIKVTLDGAGQKFDQVFWVKIEDREKPKEKVKKEEEDDLPEMGLPELILVYEKNPENKEGIKTWSEMEEGTGEQMDWETVMYPLVKGDTLESIYINMDSRVLKNFKAKEKNISEQQMEIADKKYYSSVYFHTLFLYTITRKNKFRIYKELENNKEDEVDLGSYLRSLFDNFYSEFILSFGVNELMASLGE